MKNIIKSIIPCLLMGLIAFSTMAQKTKDVPQAVLAAFSAKYPQAQLKNWKAQKNTYLASFVMNNKKYDASYSKDGNWLITERDIRHTAGLPLELRSYLKTGAYASWHIDDMKRVRMPGQNMYQIQVDNHSGSPFEYEDMGSAENKMLCFDDDGKLIKVSDN